MQDEVINQWKDLAAPASGRGDPRIAFYEMGYAAAVHASSAKRPTALLKVIAAGLLLAVVGSASFFAGQSTRSVVDPNIAVASVEEAEQEVQADDLSESMAAVITERKGATPRESIDRPALPRAGQAPRADLLSRLDLLDVAGYALVGGEVRRISQPTPRRVTDVAPRTRSLRVSDFLQPEQIFGDG